MTGSTQPSSVPATPNRYLPPKSKDYKVLHDIFALNLLWSKELTKFKQLDPTTDLTPYYRAALLQRSPLVALVLHFVSSFSGFVYLYVNNLKLFVVNLAIMLLLVLAYLLSEYVLTPNSFASSLSLVLAGLVVFAWVFFGFFYGTYVTWKRNVALLAEAHALHEQNL